MVLNLNIMNESIVLMEHFVFLIVEMESKGNWEFVEWEEDD